ncbi:MAG TPA: hypothetical protein VNV86_10710 [Candidatus Acidoferrum sp.]|nr:hypothetical protein [Candidatus Acidoferrum sp.]
MLGYERLLQDMPSGVSFGHGSVCLWPPSELRRRQIGYSIGPDTRSLCGDGDGDWRTTWLVIGFEGECGDPVFIDTATPGYPVYTAWHGEGRWDPKPVAVSLCGLREALASVARAAKGRESPVALEQNPISAAERDTVLREIQQHNPDIDLSFWALMLGDDLKDR